MRCITDIYRLGGDLERLASLDDPFSVHLLEVVGVMDLPNFVFGRISPRLDFWKRFRQAQFKAKNTLDDGIEIVSGLPRSLLDILACFDEPAVEERLWLWHGTTGHVLQIRLWDAWRFSGILLARRTQGSYHTTSISLPTSEELLGLLVASLDSLRLGVQQPETQHLLICHALLYPYMITASEFTLLRSHPEWKAQLNRLRDFLSELDPTDNCQIGLQIIDEAWQNGDEAVDLDVGVRLRGLELALF